MNLKFYNELTHFQQTRFCGYLHASFIWRHFRTVVFIHEVNQYNWFIPSVNVSYILNISFVYSFLILHINLTEYKHILWEQNIIFANFVCKSERCRRTLVNIFQITNAFLMRFFSSLIWFISSLIWPLCGHIKISDFRSGLRTFWSDGL